MARSTTQDRRGRAGGGEPSSESPEDDERDVVRPIRVMLADDHTLLREGVRELICSQPDIEVVAEVDDSPSLELALGEIDADIVLMDLSMPGGGGLAAIPILKEGFPDVRILVLTMHEQPGHVRSALKLGADGYLAKRVATEQLITAIRAVHEGRVHVDAGLATGTLEQLVGGDEVITTDDELSGRERQVLYYVAAGYTNTETAEELGLSIKTIEGYRSRIMKKLGLSSRVELVRYALRHGILD